MLTPLVVTLREFDTCPYFLLNPTLYFTKSHTSESITEFRQSTSGLQSKGESGDLLELCSFLSAVPGSSSGAKDNFGSFPH